MSDLLITFIAIFTVVAVLIILYSMGFLTKLFPFGKDGFCIDETRVSIFVITFIVTFGLMIYAFFNFGDIPPNLLNFGFALITAITDINIIAKATEIKNINTESQLAKTIKEITEMSANNNTNSGK